MATAIRRTILDRTGNSAFIDIIDVCPSIQKNVNWKKVADAGIRGVYIQCSRYSSTPELAYESYAEAASKAGLAVGAYHFAACDSSAVEQAEFFLRRMKNFGLNVGDLPPSMDLEYAKKTQAEKGGGYVVQWGVDFMTRLEKEMAHRHMENLPIWYTFPNFAAGLQPSLEVSKLASNWPLWLARYKANSGPRAAWYPEDDWEPTLVPKGCPKPTLVQYSGNDGYPVSGVAGSCDRNVFFGSSGDFDLFRGIVRPVDEVSGDSNDVIRGRISS